LAIMPREDDRREAIRFACNLKARFRPISLLQIVPVPAQVCDLSILGIGLICRVPLAPGTFIVISLEKTNGTCSIVPTARVARPAPAKGNFWLLGCSFIKELSPDNLKALIS